MWRVKKCDFYLVSKLEYDKGRKEKQILSTQAIIDNLSLDFRNNSDNLHLLEGQIAEANKNIMSLQAESKDVENANDRARNEAMAQQRAHTLEMSKNADLTGKIATMETILENRENHIDDQKGDLEALKRAFAIAQDNSLHLETELEHIKEAIEDMHQQNDEVVRELQDASRKDEEVREMLNRKEKFENLKNRSGNKLGESLTVLDKIKSSPIRKKTMIGTQQNGGQGGISPSKQRNGQSPPKY